MIYLNGINLVADDENELHRFAYDMGVERAWFRKEDNCYDVICPFKLERIRNFIEGRKDINKKSPKL